jgi:lactoylglutathione lyase
MKFRHTTLSVSNLETSLQFYEGVVGLPLRLRFQAGPDTEIAFLGAEGDTAVELIAHGGAAPGSAGAGVSLGFAVDSLEEKIEFLKSRGISTVGEISSPNPQTRYIFALDPDGYRIQFLETR